MVSLPFPHPVVISGQATSGKVICLYETDTETGCEKLLDADQCPLQILEQWTSNNVANVMRFVLRWTSDTHSDIHIPTHSHFSRSRGFNAQRNSFLRQSIRKKDYYSLSSLVNKFEVVDINIECRSDSLDDTETESENSDLGPGSKKEFHQVEAIIDTSEYSEPEDIECPANNSVILESFFT